MKMGNKTTNLPQYSVKYLITLDNYFNIFENNEENVCNLQTSVKAH